jgi:hypothetical protein
VSLAVLPPIQVAQHTVPALASPGAWLCEGDHAPAVICEPASLCGWQCLNVIRPQGDEQCDDLVCKVDGHGLILSMVGAA